VTTFFDHTNSAPGAIVIDMDFYSQIDHVLSVDIAAGELVCAYWPLRVRGDEIEKYMLRYERIEMTLVGGLPCRFECHERIGGKVEGYAPRADEVKRHITGLTETAPDMRYCGLGFCDKGNE
jgi:hypothetical protein